MEENQFPQFACLDSGRLGCCCTLRGAKVAQKTQSGSDTADLAGTNAQSHKR
jgi:hypothetical protein